MQPSIQKFFMQKKVSAAIVAYKSNPAEIQKAALSFLQSQGFEKKLIIIDHSPRPDLSVYFKEMENTAYFHHPENKGFGAGHNLAIQQIIDPSDFHLVLNPDVYFENKVLTTLVDYFVTNPNAGALMPKIVNPSGELQYLAKLLPTPFDLLFKRFLPDSWTKKRAERFQLKFTDYQQIMNVPYLSGCFMFLRMEVLKKIGGFDERFFMYPEDIDLSRRIHAQYETIFFPNVSIVHAHQAGSYKSMKMLWIHSYNMMKYFNKWGWIWDKQRKKMNQACLERLKQQGYY